MGCFSAPDRREDLHRILEKVCGSSDAVHKTHAYSKSCRILRTVGHVFLATFVIFLLLWIILAPPIVGVCMCCHFYRHRGQL